MLRLAVYRDQSASEAGVGQAVEQTVVRARLGEQADEQDVARTVQEQEGTRCGGAGPFHPQQRPHFRPSAPCFCLPRMYEVRTLWAC